MGARWRKGRFHPGFQWRVLAHRRDIPIPVELTSDSYAAPVEFDELVIDHWFHLEQMSERNWWMDVGGMHINIEIDGYGKPTTSSYENETPDEVAKRCERVRTGT